MLRGATGTVAAILVLAGILTTAPAGAGENMFAVKVAKHRDGPYKVDIKANFEPGQTRSFWFRIHNGDDESFDLVFEDAGTSNEDGYRTRWFKAGKNVSDAVEQAGEPFTVAPGQSKFFNAKQRAGDPAEPSCLAGQATLPAITSDLSSVRINGQGCSF